ncbi:adenine deaminase C-terminal domain-containing protein [Shigella flexneri]
MSFIAVLERYTGNGLLRLVVCWRLWTNHSAPATVSHDSHNIVVIGRSAEEMALAVNQVIQDGGGWCVDRRPGSKSSADRPLPAY